MPILFWGALFGLIASIFVRVASSIVVVIKAVVPIIVRVFDFMGKVVVRVGRAFGDFARTIANGAQMLWSNVLKPAIGAIQKFFQRIAQFIDKVTAPIKAILEKINRALDWVWTKIIAPILDVIEKVRLVFRLLAELGLEWAAAIDRILQQIETRIFDAFREIRSFVNTISSFIDLLFDPRGWIKSAPWLYTLFKWGGNVVAILTKLGLDPLTPARLEEHRAANQLQPLASTVARFRDGTIRQSDGVQQAAARFRSRQSGKL